MASPVAGSVASKGGQVTGFDGGDADEEETEDGVEGPNQSMEGGLVGPEQRSGGDDGFL